ncbi:MAG TPA: GNAT family N-acetyltransferase [Solirubrobacteraceae bacterium]|jgi:ribosomal protein S18 acetylase RimI-like enzyme|nr:GNAT family N-acetyltransferase [Solirubrobacteraceae bacterium]
MSEPEAVIRPARRDDIAAVLELWAAARSPHATTPDDNEAVGLAVAAGALLVAERDGRIVGTLLAGWDGWRGSMARLAVAPDTRRQGIAHRLVAAGERRLRDCGARRINALVDASDDGVREMWRKAGYADDPATTRFVRNIV